MFVVGSVSGESRPSHLPSADAESHIRKGISRARPTAFNRRVMSTEPAAASSILLWVECMTS